MIPRRGYIYRIRIKRFFDKDEPKGRIKYVLVLQEGSYFEKFNSVEILLITSDKSYKPRDEYKTDVEIEIGTTKLPQKSWILCAQPYPILKKLFSEKEVECYGRLSPEKMDEVDEAIYNGLCMGLQHELDEEEPNDDISLN